MLIVNLQPKTSMYVLTPQPLQVQLSPQLHELAPPQLQEADPQSQAMLMMFK